MLPTESLLCDAEGFERLIARLAREIAGANRPGVPLRLVGVRTRGVPIARRLAERLKADAGIDCLVGAVDITLYRDDLGRGDHWPLLKGTEIPFDVDGTDVVLVDDVLFTGRTIRAAMNGVCDLGRPARIRLAVVVDRGGRELPIRADHVGIALPTDLDERVRVRVRPIDAADEIVRSVPSDDE